MKMDSGGAFAANKALPPVCVGQRECNGVEQWPINTEALSFGMQGARWRSWTAAKQRCNIMPCLCTRTD